MVNKHASPNLTVSTAACLVFLPLILNFSKLQKLFWFSDDFALLHGLATQDYLQWLFQPFGENISPVFKLLWSTLVYLSSGDYMVMVIALWAVHFGIVLCLGLVVSACGLSNFASFLTCATLGLASSQSNLLFFSYHLNAGLATLFGLLAGLLILKSNSSSSLIYYLVCLTASLLSFSLGFVVAAVFSMYFCWQLFVSKTNLEKKYLSTTILVTALSLLLLIYNGAFAINPANRSIYSALNYGFSYWSLSPLYLMTSLKHKFAFLTPILLLSALVKSTILLVSLKYSKKRNPKLFGLFILLILFDLIHSILLGWGRHHEGIETILVPRYQRIALICIIPLIAFLISEVGNLIVKNYQVVTSASTIIIWLYFLCVPWMTKFYHHARWQGSMGRRILVTGKLKPKEKNLKPPWHGIPPVLNYEQTKELTKKFNLH